MRNTRNENLSEHSLEVAIIAHALCVIKNRRLGGNIDANAVAAAAVFHDTSEIITGDMPTPIKYYNNNNFHPSYPSNIPSTQNYTNIELWFLMLIK